MKEQFREAQAVAKAATWKTVPWARWQARSLLETAGFMALVMVVPAILAHTPQNQWITGTLVNALLFLAVWRVGILNAIVVAALPSSVALLRGLLPAPMIIMLPYIIASNITLILTFGLLKVQSLTARVVASALAKTVLLWGAVALLVNVPRAIAVMMEWPQLITALAGGLIAAGLIRIRHKK